MITHAAPGDTFWDIIRKGATAAAAKDNVTLKYSNDDDPTKQATLIQDAINSKVDGIAVTDPAPAAICPTIKKAVAAGIPVVMFNAGVSNWQQCGGMAYFGQDETIAGDRGGQAARVGGRQEGAVRPAGAGPGPARGPVRRGEAGPRLRGHDEPSST